MSAEPPQLNAHASDISQTAGAVQVAKMYGELKEDEFEMRFRVIDVADAKRWSGLELKAQSQSLDVQRVVGGAKIQLPNGGSCTITLSNLSGSPAYSVNFSSPEVGVTTTIPVARGNVLLLGAPQNNAHDATFVQIIISGADEKSK
ncbi:hypothetical protein ACXR0O_20830 [Verrucomicrobiota bacterium sgz303538]